MVSISSQILAKSNWKAKKWKTQKSPSSVDRHHIDTLVYKFHTNKTKTVTASVGTNFCWQNEWINDWLNDGMNQFFLLQVLASRCPKFVQIFFRLIPRKKHIDISAYYVLRSSGHITRCRGHSIYVRTLCEILLEWPKYHVAKCQ